MMEKVSDAKGGSLVGIKTLVIAPYRGLMELTLNLVPELEGFDITVVQADLNEVLPLIKQYEDEGFEMIISRGGTARLLRKHSALPVTEIKISGYDIMRLLTLLKDYQMQVELIGMTNIIESVVTVSSLMDITIPYTIIGHESETEAAIERAKARGVKVIVGYSTQVAKAKEAGLQGVLITSGRESVLSAFYDAKHVYDTLNRYKNRYIAYERMAQKLDVGVVVADAQGGIEYANDAFYALFNSHPQELRERSLFERYPGFQRLVHDLGAFGERSIAIYDPERKASIAGGVVPAEPGKELYYFQVSSSDGEDQEINIIYPNPFADSFPQLFLSGGEYHQSVEEAIGCLSIDKSVAIWGEKGAGKRLFADAVYARLGGRDGGFVQIEVKQGTESAFERLYSLLKLAKPESLLYIAGIERFPLASQKRLRELHEEIGGKVMYAFMTDPKELREERKLDKAFFETFKACVIWIAPLRERADELGEFIRPFIAKYNELYGKQIVGIKPEALEALKRHPWRGNLTELKQAVKRLVKHAKTEYIDVDALSFMDGDADRTREESDVAGNKKPINLNQTLDQIERDIIRIVLEEEDMNQSKAAARLGINRSTLWRRVKELEESNASDIPKKAFP